MFSKPWVALRSEHGVSVPLSIDSSKAPSSVFVHRNSHDELRAAFEGHVQQSAAALEALQSSAASKADVEQVRRVSWHSAISRLPSADLEL